jgi:hypothetical protein
MKPSKSSRWGLPDDSLDIVLTMCCGKRDGFLGFDGLLDIDYFLLTVLQR